MQSKFELCISTSIRLVWQCHTSGRLLLRKSRLALNKTYSNRGVLNCLQLILGTREESTSRKLCFMNNTMQNVCHYHGFVFQTQPTVSCCKNDPNKILVLFGWMKLINRICNNEVSFGFRIPFGFRMPLIWLRKWFRAPLVREWSPMSPFITMV